MKMVLLYHTKTVGGLPDAKGSQPSFIPAQVIDEDNKEVQKATKMTGSGPFKKYSSTLHAEVGKYAVSMVQLQQHSSFFKENLLLHPNFRHVSILSVCSSDENLNNAKI